LPKLEQARLVLQVVKVVRHLLALARSLIRVGMAAHPIWVAISVAVAVALLAPMALVPMVAILFHRIQAVAAAQMAAIRVIPEVLALAATTALILAAVRVALALLVRTEHLAVVVAVKQTPTQGLATAAKKIYGLQRLAALTAPALVVLAEMAATPVVHILAVMLEDMAAAAVVTTTTLALLLDHKASLLSRT
jgi:hypothetical protein